MNENSLQKWDEVIQSSMEHTRQKEQEWIESWNKAKGMRVKHLTYLLTGTVQGGFRIQGGMLRISVKWDNGAESLEFPASFEEIK